MNNSFKTGFEKAALKRPLLLGGGLLGGTALWKLWGKDKIAEKIRDYKVGVLEHG